MNANLTQIEYFEQLVSEAKAAGFKGSFYYAGHQINSVEDLIRFASTSDKAIYTYTLEHYTRRKELMPIKGRVDLEGATAIMKAMSDMVGLERTHYYYIVGIDDPNVTRRHMTELANIALPETFLFSPYSPVHESYYFRQNRFDRLIDAVGIQKFMLDLYAQPLPGGSNRSLFDPRAKMSGNQVII